MTDLTKLDVSLTKHGSHKIAILLRKYDKDEVLQHLKGSEPGVNIELAQAKKNLSVSHKGRIPDLWNEARKNGNETIDALVLISIILSHHELIKVMQNATDRYAFSGMVKRDQLQNEKAYTNLAHTIDELGYSAEYQKGKDYFRYDFQNLFQIQGLHVLVEKLIRLKLTTAKWDENNTIVEESIRLKLHQIFCLTEEQFSAWLTSGSLTTEKHLIHEIEDLEFFAETSHDDLRTSRFEFRPGHNPKKIGTAVIDASTEPLTVALLHNEIQNQMYESLATEYGAACVGTEVSTGNGTAIDIVVKTDQFCWFYEIKTGLSVRGCIRQAIPQLLEYAYWPGDGRSIADKLIIVSPLELTSAAATYLDFLRQRFKLNIYYESVQIKTSDTEK